MGYDFRHLLVQFIGCSYYSHLNEVAIDIFNNISFASGKGKPSDYQLYLLVVYTRQACSDSNVPKCIFCLQRSKNCIKGNVSS